MICYIYIKSTAFDFAIPNFKSNLKQKKQPNKSVRIVITWRGICNLKRIIYNQIQVRFYDRKFRRVIYHA